MTTRTGISAIVALAACSVAAQAVVVYDGSLGGGTQRVSDQGWFSYQPSSGAPSTAANGRTTIDSSASNSLKGGYFSHLGLGSLVFPINGSWPTLNATSGYTIRIDARVASETHATPHRAGFNLISIASDRTGVELGFWTTEVWCQEGGAAPSLFTHAEGSSFDTTRLVRYTFVAQSGSYTLYAGGRQILTGAMRNYTAFDSSAAGLPFDPYETRNLLFVGDDTSSAGALSQIARIEVLTTPVRPCGFADIVGPGGTTGSDGQLTVDDLVAFLAAFFAGDTLLADCSSTGGSPGPDGQITVDDLIAYLTGFFAGCS
ncbi:MAG: choice-of-anchor Y domain-containing protein [Phycisphaerales bacterium]